MVHAFRPLLCRSPLLPGESLPSLLIRLSVQNFYPSLTAVERLCLERLPQVDNVKRPTHMATYQALADLVQLEPYQLYLASVHSLAPTLTAPTTPAQGATLPTGEPVSLLNPFRQLRSIRPDAQAQFCPGCLQEEAYHHLAWSALAVTMCLRHECLLVSRCPQCQGKLNIRAIVQTRCEQCGSDLMATPPVSLRGDDWGVFTQQLLMAWLGLAPPPTSAWRETIPQQSPAVLYRLMEGLRASAMRADPHWTYLHSGMGLAGLPYHYRERKSLKTARFHPTNSYIWHATAVKGLINWPEGFYEFLRAYRRRPSTPAKGKLNTDLGIIYHYWLPTHWNHPAFQFVQEAFDTFLLDEYARSFSLFRSERYKNNPVLVQRSKYIHQADAISLLGISFLPFKRLVDTGLLTCHQAEGQPAGSRPFPAFFFERAEVLALRQRWQNQLSLEDTITWLGAQRETLLRMVEMGLLPANHSSTVNGLSIWLFKKEVLTDFLDRLDACTQLIEPTSGTKFVTLTTATKMLNYYAFDAAQLIGRVLAGQLPAYRRAGDILKVQDVQFIESDVRSLAQQIRQENGWVERKEIVKQMRVSLRVVQRWIESGLLSPCAMVKNKMYFDPEAVEQFMTNYVFTTEAAEILRLNPYAVRSWAKRGRLNPVSGPLVNDCHFYLFRREEVERLRPENRVNAVQMAARLGISLSHFLQDRVKSGKIKPYSGPGVDKFKQYLFVLED